MHGIGYQFIGEVEAIETSRKPRAAAGKDLPAAKPGSLAPGSLPPGPLTAPPAWPEAASAGVRGAMAVWPRDVRPLEFFALDEEVAAWMAALPAARGAARLDTLIALAWHLRQRDTRGRWRWPRRRACCCSPARAARRS